MRRILVALFVLGVLPLRSSGQNPPPNIRIHPSVVTQTEPAISVHPLNPNVMFASAVTINSANGFRSEGVYMSTNGGLAWTGTDTCQGQLISNHGGDPGPIVHTSGQFVLTHIGSFIPGVYSHYSTNQGQTWSNAYTISSNQPEDKGSSAIDNNPASPFYGRLYAAWVSLLIPYPVSFSSSSNAGASWSSPAAINGTPPARCSGGTIAAGSDGKVYVTWAGISPVAPFKEILAGFAVSTDGGAQWTVTQNVFAMNGISGTLSTKGNIRVNGLPQIAVDNSAGPRRGWVYIVSTERDLAPAGSDPDVVLHRSSNGGQSWSAGIRVNRDNVNNGKIQYFPALDIDNNGGVNILFYDDRNTSIDSAEIMLARSTDGGDSWAERTVSDHRFKPKPVTGGASNYQGDHIALLSVGPRLHALWMDDVTGLYQVWQAIIDLNPNDVRIQDGAIPESFELLQNYPNPFNPTTTIRFATPKRARVTVEIYTALAQRVLWLRDETESPGTFSVEWDGRNEAGQQLSSGVYFVRFVATPIDGSGSFTGVRKMVLLR